MTPPREPWRDDPYYYWSPEGCAKSGDVRKLQQCARFCGAMLWLLIFALIDV